MKRNWLLILVLFLLVVNTGLVSTLLINRNARDKYFDKKPIHWKKDNIDFHRPDRFEDYLNENLNLTAEQSEKIRQLSIDFHEKKGLIYRNINELRQEYVEELAQENPNKDKLNNLADSLGKIQAKLIINDFQHYRDIRSVCTKEQAEILDSLGKEHMCKRNKGVNSKGQERGKPHGNY